MSLCSLQVREDDASSLRRGGLCGHAAGAFADVPRKAWRQSCGQEQNHFHQNLLFVSRLTEGNKPSLRKSYSVGLLVCVFTSMWLPTVGCIRGSTLDVGGCGAERHASGCSGPGNRLCLAEGRIPGNSEEVDSLAWQLSIMGVGSNTRLSIRY